MTKTEAALRLAVKAHATQIRKTDNSPYIIHPIMVAHILSEYGVSEEVITAALLHDVLEDTNISREEIIAAAGQSVLSLVDAVSEDKSLPYEERKAAYIAQVLAGGEPVWLVSVADKVHNALSLLDYIEAVGAAAWDVFNRGKEDKLGFEKKLHAALVAVWHHPLLDRYGELIKKLETA